MAWLESFEPLRITAEFACGVICDPWLPLDGIVYFQANRDQRGAQALTSPGGSEHFVSKKTSMPFALINRGRPDWFFSCSFATGETGQQWWIEEDIDYWNKRFDSSLASMVDFGKRKAKVIIEKGEYKAYHSPVTYRVARSCYWYAVGDKAWIEALLSTVTHIGKKTAQGWGRVKAWRVESFHSDWSVWSGDRLMRAVPAEEVADKGAFTLARYGIRPSYYRYENQGVVALP